MDEAHAHFEAALAVSREVKNPRHEGMVLGSLGALKAEGGRMEEARAQLQEGERLLREVEDPVELALLLCTRARLEARAGDFDAARAALSEAEALAIRTGAGADSGLGKELAEAREAVDSPLPAAPPE